TSCTTDADCAAQKYCNAAGVCVPQKTPGATCDPALDCKVSGCAECTTGACANGYCCDRSCNGSCEVCNTNPGTCTLLAAGSPGAPSCAPYLCTGAGGACPSACGGDGDCISTAFCEGGVCKVKGNLGDTCSGATRCLSGFCADGVCCNVACSGQCEACDV